MSRPKGSRNKVKKLDKVEETPIVPLEPTFDKTTAILQANNTEYLAEGESVLEALNNLPVHYLELKTKGTIFVTRGEHTVQRFFFPKPLKFLIRNEARRQYWAQLLEAELKSKENG